jgi:hypothetical protein
MSGESSFGGSYTTLAISMDASDSAYQIMSYFLLNEELARKTNLISRREWGEKEGDIRKGSLFGYIG